MTNGNAEKFGERIEKDYKLIGRFIPCVVGHEDELAAKSSQAFSIGFYKAIASGRELDFAFKLGQNAIRLENPDEKGQPFLLIR
ncbi:MAG: hypothetical protein R8P61_05910 [Bacteroidia bacterium]|nr:hypothetical protein [Bacteroidia bacterium]